MEQIIKQLNLEVLDTEIEKLPEKIGKYLKIIENSEAIEKSSKKKNCSEKQEINIEAMKIENLNKLYRRIYWFKDREKEKDKKFSEILSINGLTKIKETFKKVLENPFVSPSILYLCWKIFLALDYINSVTSPPVDTVDEKLYIDIISHLLRNKKLYEILLEENFKSCKCFRNYINSNNEKIQELVNYFLFYSMLSPKKSLSSRKIKSAKHTLVKGPKKNLIYYEYGFNLLYYIFFYSFQDEEVDLINKNGFLVPNKKENYHLLQNIMFNGFVSMFDKTKTLSNFSTKRMIDIFVFTYGVIIAEKEKCKTNNLPEDKDSIKIEEYKETLFKAKDKNLTLFDNIIESLNTYCKKRTIKTSDMGDIKLKEKTLKNLNLNESSVNMLLSWNNTLIKEFYERLPGFYQKIISKAKKVIKQKINDGTMLKNNIAIILNYVLEDNQKYTKENKNYVYKLLIILNQIKEAQLYNDTINTFLFEIISRYQESFTDEWNYIYPIVKDNPVYVSKLFSILAKLKNKNKYKGEKQLLRDLCNLWSQEKKLSNDDDCTLQLFLRLSCENDHLFQTNFNRVYDKILDHMNEKKVISMFIIKEMVRYIKYYYLKQSKNEIWLKNREYKLVYIIVKIMNLTHSMNIEFKNWEEFVLLLLTEARNLEFFKSLVFAIFDIPLINLPFILSNTFLDYGNKTFTIPKLQILTDKLSDFFTTQKTFWKEKDVEEEDDKNLKNIIQFIMNYYIDSNCRLYTEKSKIQNKEVTNIVVDNQPNPLSNDNYAILNLHSLFSLLEIIFQDLTNIEKKIFVYMKVLELLDKHLSKTFYFFKNADITFLLMKLNELKGGIEMDGITEENLLVLHQIIHFFSNVTFHTQCDSDMPNPYKDTVLINRKYHLFKEFELEDNKITIQSFLNSSLNFSTKCLSGQIAEMQTKNGLFRKKKNVTKSGKKEKEKEQSNNRPQIVQYMIEILNSLQYLTYSCYDFEKEDEIEPYNIIPLSTDKENTSLIDNNRTLQQLIPIFVSLFEIRNKLTDNDIYIGYAILNYLYMNKELLCKFDILIFKSIILLLSLGWQNKVDKINDILKKELKAINLINGTGEIRLLNNTFSFGSYFNICCDYLVNYFTEQTTLTQELLNCFTILFYTDDKETYRNKYMLQMIKWNVSSKSERDNLTNKIIGPDDINRVYVDKLKIVSLFHNKTDLNKFDVIIRSPIANSVFTIEIPKEGKENINNEKTYKILNKIVNGIEEENENQKKEEKKELSPEEIEEIMQNNSFLFQRIYKFSEHSQMEIPIDPENNINLKNKIKQLDAISVYRLYECFIVCITEDGTINKNFIQFINALGELISPDKDIEKGTVKIHFQDINNSITFTVNQDKDILAQNTKKIELFRPHQNNLLTFNYVTIIWKEFNTPKIGKQISQPVCIVIKPYSNTHYRIKIKVSSNLEDKFKNTINMLFSNNMVIYVGNQYEILSNYIIKMVVMINMIMFSLIVGENDNKVNGFLKQEELDNVYKRYSILSSTTEQAIPQEGDKKIVNNK